MNCDLCEKDATVHLTEIVGGAASDKHYCVDHAGDRVPMPGSLGAARMFAPPERTATLRLARTEVAQGGARTVTFPDGYKTEVGMPSGLRRAVERGTACSSMVMTFRVGSERDRTYCVLFEVS